ncbi:hypothetical protein C5B85_15030 [Pseudoclavibacter sp. AY1F1]|uniref:hypothetical protein n=1 Tax=Pseudoclavibacter sp. AY1F1 TaxID=2080583 RepID=UPI000CE76EAB|nr:hypothetical protein [Pseudoclavibacter sp. AY1F1]PPF42886.1 hypothetical protein C5B85_15030 [Pseudoclavibacter sp. AY1F1]
MATTVGNTQLSAQVTTLGHRPGRWIDNGNPEDPVFWAAEGKAIAATDPHSAMPEFKHAVVSVTAA